MTPPSVLISGAGIAGPTLAWWLAAQGFRPTIVERAPAPRTGGYVIDFWGRGYDIAGRMGLVPALRERGYAVREMRIVGPDGRRTGGFGVEVFRRLTAGRYVSLPRGDLADLLYRSVADRCEMMFGDSITGLHPDDSGVDVTFEHAPPRRFDCVAGADGLHSIVRTLAFGPEQQFQHYLGYVAAAFEADGYTPRDPDVYVSYGIPGKQVARFAERGDRTVFLLVFAADQPPAIAPHDRTAQQGMLRREFADAGWECAAILDRLDAADTLYFDPVSQIRLDAWSRGRIVLLGDAAFAPSLLAGQGSALAMTAAYVLAGEMARAPGQPAAAFQRYEQLLRQFMTSKQTGASRFARSFAPRTAFGLMLRNQVSKVLGLPGVARLAFGPSLLDRIELPEYGGRVA